MPSPPTSRAGNPIPERMLLFGDSDAGKTWWLLKIAEWHQKRGSDAHFYGLCSPGNTWDPFWLPGAEFEHLENVTYFNIGTDVQEYFDVFDRKVKSRARPQDWLAVDVIGDVRGAATDEYSYREFKGKDLGSAWGTTGGKYPIEGWEWGSINRRYAAFCQNRVLPFKGHVIAMAWDRDLHEAAKSTGKGGDTPHLRGVFEQVGKAPAGDKEDYKRFRTIIHLSKNGQGEHVARTVRDKGRPGRLGEVVEMGKVTQFRGHKITNPYTDYLMKIGGWKP